MRDQDKVIEDEISQHGVRHIHVVRLGSPVDLEEWAAKAPAGVEVFRWFYKVGEEWHFHFAWKTSVPASRVPVSGTEEED